MSETFTRGRLLLDGGLLLVTLSSRLPHSRKHHGSTYAERGGGVCG